MLKIAKNGLILHLVGSFGFSPIFFASPPPSDFPTGTENFEFPPIKNLEKKPCVYVCPVVKTPFSRLSLCSQDPQLQHGSVL